MNGMFGGLRRVLWVAIRRMPRPLAAQVARLHGEAYLETAIALGWEVRW